MGASTVGCYDLRMPRSDSIKEELSWLKVVFALFVAIDASLVAWISQNFDAADGILVVMAILAVAAVTAIVVWVNRLAYRRIRELEDL